MYEAYTLLRVCERMGVGDPFAFAARLDVGQAATLIAYEQVRSAEEARERAEC